MEVNALDHQMKQNLVMNKIVPLTVNGDHGKVLRNVLKVVAVENKLDQDLSQ